MSAVEHILVDEEVKKYLEGRKKHPRESFNEVLRRELKLKGRSNEYSKSGK